MKNLIIIGAGGNSKVILDIIEAINEDFEKVGKEMPYKILGFLDDDISKESLDGFKILGTINDIERFAKEPTNFFVNGIGSNKIRERIHTLYPNVRWEALIHPSAIVSNKAKIGNGTLIMPGAIVNAGSSIGSKVIINTGAIIEHDNIIEDFAHIASGVTTAGNVHVGKCTMLGTGAKVIQGITIGSYTMIGAGAVVINDLPNACTAVGMPARVLDR